MQKIPVFALLLVCLIAVFFARAMVQDERRKLELLDEETQSSRHVLQICLDQQRRIVRIASRIGRFDRTLPADVTLTKLAALSLSDVKYSKLADILAGAQNRLILSHLRYEKRAGRLRAEMDRPLGALVSWWVEHV